jgi:hypothetical protein
LHSTFAVNHEVRPITTLDTLHFNGSSPRKTNT